MNKARREGEREGSYNKSGGVVVVGWRGRGINNGHLRGGPAPLTSDRRMAMAALATAPPPAPVPVPSPSTGSLSGATWLGSACTDGRTGNFNGTALLDS